MKFLKITPRRKENLCGMFKLKNFLDGVPGGNRSHKNGQ